jgi:choline dehydrogenase-like flavoprotein
MDCFDAIVVGSGPGAAFAAYGLKGKRVLVLDVGFDAPPPALQGNIYELRRANADLFSELIGEEYQSLHNLHQRPMSLKLKAPQVGYIVKGWRELTPILSRTFEGVLSLAKGGLANGWGAGVYRFTDQDLRGYPICARALQPYYDEITRQIGVSGANDDLAPYFGHDEDLMPPLRMAALFEELYAGYCRSRSAFERQRVFLGRTRLAVLTESRIGREPYRYDNLEFFETRNPAIYTPAYTIDELRSCGAITYLDGRLVMRFEEQSDRILVHARNLHDDKEETYCGRKLCLGAGAINTARIVLASGRDFHSRLPLLDNPMACLPFFSPRRLGSALPIHDSSLGQLNLVAEDLEKNETLQATFYGATGPLRSDILFSLPLSFQANLALVKYAAPAMGLMMLFYPGLENGGYVRLRESGELEIEFQESPSYPAVEQRLIRLLRGIGYWTHPALLQRTAMGQGLHYAATLPMRVEPRQYQTNPQGLLFGARHVHIVDGACLSRLPAKNLTFTIMANALRITRQLARDL